MERKYSTIDAIVFDILKNLAPWECKIGGPGFPEKYLYEGGGFDPETVTCIKKVGWGFEELAGKDSQGNTAQILFSIIEKGKGKVTFNYNQAEEGYFIEEISQDGRYIKGTTHFNQDPKADLITEVSANSTDDGVKVMFTFNGKEFKGEFIFGQPTIPTVLLDLLDEIKAYNPQIQVKALNGDMIMPVVGDLFIRGTKEANKDMGELISAIVAILADAIGGAFGGWAVGAAATIVWLVIDYVIEDEEEE